MRTSSTIDRRRAIAALAFGAFGLAFQPSRGASPRDDPPAKGVTRPAVDPASVDPIDIAGRPDAKTQGEDTRLVLWRDKEGVLHLRSTAKGPSTRFRGTIVAIGGAIKDVGELESLEAARRSKKGAVKNPSSADEVKWRKDTIDFSFHTINSSDEISIKVTPETTHLKLTFLIDGKAARERIFLGKAGTHPSRDIVVVPLGR